MPTRAPNLFTMRYPWEQQEAEPSEAYVAYLADHERRAYLLEDKDKILARFAETLAAAQSAQRWRWDERSAAWDAEMDRRRVLKAARAQVEAANGLIMLASANLLLAVGEATDSAEIAVMREALATGSALLNDAHNCLKQNGAPIPWPPVAVASGGAEPQHRSPSQVEETPTVAVPSAEPTAPSESQRATRVPPPSQPERTDEPDQTPPPAPPRQESVSRPPPSGTDSARSRKLSPTELGLKPPTRSPRCGQRGGLTDHKTRGESPCEECIAYRQAQMADKQSGQSSPPPKKPSPPASHQRPPNERPPVPQRPPNEPPPVIMNPL